MKKKRSIYLSHLSLEEAFRRMILNIQQEKNISDSGRIKPFFNTKKFYRGKFLGVRVVFKSISIAQTGRDEYKYIYNFIIYDKK